MLLLSTCLEKESARDHFRELWNVLPATEAQRQLVPDSFLRKKKLTPAHKIKGCGRGDCSDGKGRSSQQLGIMRNLSVHHGKGVGSMFLVGHVEEQAHTGTSEGHSEKKSIIPGQDCCGREGQPGTFKVPEKCLYQSQLGPSAGPESRRHCLVRTVLLFTFSSPQAAPLPQENSS